MECEILLFAAARQVMGCDRLVVRLGEPANVGALRRAVAEQVPALAPLLPSMLVAVDAQYATDETPIEPGAEVALIPPVSGGARPHSRPRFRTGNVVVDPLALELIPEELARELRVLPLDFDGERLKLVFARGTDVPASIARLRAELNFANPIAWSHGAPRALERAIDEVYRLPATRVHNCPAPSRSNCPGLWLLMIPAADPGFRVCKECRSIVHLCDDAESAEAFLEDDRAVAIYQEVEGEHGASFDLDHARGEPQ